MTIVHRHIALDWVTSTNDEAMARLRAGEPGDFVVTAREQSNGRGRQGRAWTSPPGNLYMSLALRDPAPAALAPQLGFVAGVALAKALRAQLDGDVRTQLKWPNDVLLDGRKIAGLLVEASLTGAQARIIVGIGINVATSPADAAYPATSLADAGPLPALDTMRDALTDAFLRRRSQWHRTGLGPLRDEAADRLHGVGAPATVALDRDRTDLLHGINEGLAPSGALRLRTADGAVHTLLAGDVLA